MSSTRELDLTMHDRRRRAENRGDGIRASLSLHQEERAARARATDSGESPLQRLQRQADETLGGYATMGGNGGNREVAYDADGNEIEDGEANFGFVETEREEGDE